MLESTVENALVRAVKRKKGKCPKGERLGKNWPDRIPLVSPGRVCFVELKRPRGPTAPGQILMGKVLQKLGFDYFRLYTLEAVEEWERDWLGD
jgi:hypothetical protein